MNTGLEWKNIYLNLKVFTIWAISSILDSAFLALWVWVQWLTDNFIERFHLSAIDRWMLSSFQAIFAISTLAPILIYIYVDITKMILQARRMIRQERNKGESND